MRTSIRRCLRTALAGSLLFGGTVVASVIVGSLPASAGACTTICYVAILSDSDGGGGSLDSVGTAVAGEPIIYTLTASNTGNTSTAVDGTFTLSDPIGQNPDISTDTYTAVETGGASGFTSSGTGSIDDNTILPGDSQIVYTINAVILSSATGTLTSSVSITNGNSSGTSFDSDTLVDTVAFNSEGGSPVGSLSGSDGSPITLPNAPTYPGFTFEGWYDGTNTYAAGTPYTVPVGGITLDATWTANSAAPLVTTQPISAIYANGGSASFTAAASGNPAPTVQWQYSLNAGGTWANLAGATSPTFSASGLSALENGWQVQAVFTNIAGSVNSNAATLTEATAPVVTTQPISAIYANGGSASFTAAASGNPAPTVQWQYSLNSGGTWANIAGATSPTLSASGLNALVNTWQVRAVFANEAGTVNSTAATLTLATAPLVSTQPTNQTYTNGGSVSITAAASGKPAPTVQWQYSFNGGSTWANLAGATSPTFSASGLNALENGWQVRAVFANEAGTVNSHAATLTER
jgi:Listeria-Bacteroides repeat domain (List_Bact_rpt)